MMNKLAEDLKLLVLKENHSKIALALEKFSKDKYIETKITSLLNDAANNNNAKDCLSKIMNIMNTVVLQKYDFDPTIMGHFYFQTIANKRGASQYPKTVKHFNTMMKIVPEIHELGVQSQDAHYKTDNYSGYDYKPPYNYRDDSYHNIIKYFFGDQNFEAQLKILENHFKGLSKELIDVGELMKPKYLNMLLAYFKKDSTETCGKTYFDSTAKILSSLKSRGFLTGKDSTLDTVYSYVGNNKADELEQVIGFYNDNVLIKDFGLWKDQ